MMKEATRHNHSQETDSPPANAAITARKDAHRLALPIHNDSYRAALRYPSPETTPRTFPKSPKARHTLKQIAR